MADNTAAGIDDEAFDASTLSTSSSRKKFEADAKSPPLNVRT
jgi:hypothetical protein